MTHNATDGDIQTAAIKAASSVDGFLGVDTWESLGSSHDDAVQVASMAAWKAASRFDGSCPLEAWLFMKSKYGLMDYVRELRKDREKRSSARVVQVGLDDEEVVWKTQEISLDDEDCSIQPEAAPEVHGEEAGPSDSQVAIRSLVDTVLVGTLSGRERQVVRLRFGFDGEPLTQAQIAKVTGMSQPTVYRVLDEAMKVLRAELRAEEIVGL